MTVPTTGKWDNYLSTLQKIKKPKIFHISELMGVFSTAAGLSYLTAMSFAANHNFAIAAIATHAIAGLSLHRQMGKTNHCLAQQVRYIFLYPAILFACFTFVTGPMASLACFVLSYGLLDHLMEVYYGDVKRDFTNMGSHLLIYLKQASIVLTFAGTPHFFAITASLYLLSCLLNHKAYQPDRFYGSVCLAKEALSLTILYGFLNIVANPLTMCATFLLCDQLQRGLLNSGYWCLSARRPEPMVSLPI